jgi:hypothetical protein
MSQHDNIRHIRQISRASDAHMTSGYVTIAFPTTELHKRSGSTAHGPTTLLLAERSGPQLTEDSQDFKLGGEMI